MTLLETRGLTARYGDFQALFGVDIALAQGQTVAIIGANGAGKTTLMCSVSGVLRNAPDQVLFDGRAVGALPADEITRLGIAMVPEGRRLFPSLSISNIGCVVLCKQRYTSKQNCCKNKKLKN